MFQTHRLPACILLASLLVPHCLAAQSGTEPSGTGANAAPASVAAGAGHGPVTGEPLPLLVGRLALPFTYRVVSDEITFSTTFGLATDQRVEILPMQGARAGKPIVISARYIVPEANQNGLVQAALQAESEKYAADPRTRVIKPLRVGGFDFTVADTFENHDGREQRTIRLMGQVNGNLANFFVNESLEGEGPSDLVDVMAGLEIDYTATLRFRARLDAEGKRAITGDRLLTAVGTIDEPKGIDARLTSTTAWRDGNGKLVGSSQSFGFYKMGFWTVQRFGLTVGCTLGLPADDAARAKLVDPFDPDGERIKRISRTSVRLGGLPATKLELELTARSGSRTQATRWYGEDGAAQYIARIDRLGSRAQQLKLEEQLSAMAFACTPATAIEVAPAPVAPPAPAAQDAPPKAP